MRFQDMPYERIDFAKVRYLKSFKFQPVSMETKRLQNGYLFTIFWLTNGYTTLIMSIEIIFNHVRILMF